MSFYLQWQQQDWDALALTINSKTEADVVQALAKPKRDWQDFLALVSPAAESHVEGLAGRSMQLTRQRFGNNVGLYVPLYLSNLCANECDYCGFSMSNRIKRHTLDETELERELQAIKAMGFDNILLVTGEHETKVGMDYFRRMLPRVKSHFTYLQMEVQPLDTAEYQELKTLGLDAVMVYQETYHSRTYAQHHLRGNKTDFRYRLETPDRLGQAGIDKIGIGALLGLASWRVEAAMVALHLDYLQRTYWRSRYSVSFPRLRPCTGGLEPVSPVGERQLVQLIAALRLFAPEVDLSLSTRESAHFRDNVFPLGITTASAASSTRPGGYAERSDDLEQFSIDDDRTPQAVADALVTKGLQPVWKDWEPVYSGIVAENEVATLPKK
ncbi:2-iminoacetate synthase ThiH [Ferrimonas balearica]|uniref:2-iminoacetate synthase ThiH n=1 Tax=Ferrimonas balearica TaxID=44012 RepID=UPI001C99237F|nr:2-iminoacetate synthase ThiH [Ferrimonas balearica]MBY5920284.1 2-iminoacetate synthase ThiH [Ferrimonas balearica]MBY5997031.1 2-iminoacetate synthase ThiH [Ferrimonas balearica]